MSKILVGYATKSGSTAEVATRIGETLRADGTEVDVRPLAEISDVSGYDAAVIGGPMILGWHPQALKFVEQHQAQLGSKPVAYFITCHTMHSAGETQVENVPVTVDPKLPTTPHNPNKLARHERMTYIDTYVQPALHKAAQIKPVNVGVFKGKVDYSRLGLFAKVFVRFIIRADEGDFRNWDAITGWADQLRTQLIAKN